MRFLPSFWLTIFIVLFFCQFGFAQKKNSVLTHLYSPLELKVDATILKEVVLKMHPAIGVYESKEHYIWMFDNFINSLSDSLTEKEFRLRTKLLLNELHCGHTEVIYSNSYYKEVSKRKWNYSPYLFIPIKEKVFVLANLNRKKDSVLQKGAEIISINGIKVDSILRFSKRFVSSDGFNESGKEHYVQLGFNSYLLGLFSRPDVFTLEYRLGPQFKTHTYHAIQLKGIPPLPLGPKEDSLMVRKKRRGMAYRFLDTNKTTFLLRLDKFSHVAFRLAYKRIFKKCQKNKCENLIIDLRNNGGGSLANSYRLLSYLIDTSATQTLRTTVRNYPLKKYTRGNLGFKFTRMVYGIIGKKSTRHDTDYYVYTIKPRKKYHFDKKVFVLINGGSFSASCLVAAYLSKNPRVTFVGEETGGAIEGCNAGVTPYYTLPHTHLKVRIPSFRVLNDVQETQTGHGIYPNYATPYTLKDIFLKKDLELIKVKELLQLNE